MAARAIYQEDVDRRFSAAVAGATHTKMPRVSVKTKTARTDETKHIRTYEMEVPTKMENINNNTDFAHWSARWRYRRPEQRADGGHRGHFSHHQQRDQVYRLRQYILIRRAQRRVGRWNLLQWDCAEEGHCRSHPDRQQRTATYDNAKRCFVHTNLSPEHLLSESGD